jgi:hypothetical protein
MIRLIMQKQRRMRQKQLETHGMVYIPTCLVGPGLVWHSLVPDLLGPGLAHHGLEPGLASLGVVHAWVGQKLLKSNILRVFS